MINNCIDCKTWKISNKVCLWSGPIFTCVAFSSVKLIKQLRKPRLWIVMPKCWNIKGGWWLVRCNCLTNYNSCRVWHVAIFIEEETTYNGLPMTWGRQHNFTQLAFVEAEWRERRETWQQLQNEKIGKKKTESDWSEQ